MNAPQITLRLPDRLHGHADNTHSVASFAADEIATNLAAVENGVVLSGLQAAGCEFADSSVSVGRDDLVGLGRGQRGGDQRVHFRLHQCETVPHTLWGCQEGIL